MPKSHGEFCTHMLNMRPPRQLIIKYHSKDIYLVFLRYLLKTSLFPSNSQLFFNLSLTLLVNVSIQVSAIESTASSVNNLMLKSEASGRSLM